MLSTEKLGEEWAGKSVEERWQQGIFNFFRASNSSRKIQHVCVRGYVHVCSKKIYKPEDFIFHVHLFQTSVK